MPSSKRVQTLGEEIANAVTHGVGALLALVGLVVAVALAAVHGDAWRIVSVSVYGFMMLVLYLSSTLYHAVTEPRVKHVFQVIDHATIYLMIAGSYTPFTLVALREASPAWGWSIFASVWVFAILGVIFQSCYINRFPRLFTGLYLVMGWIMAIAIYPLWKAMGTAPIVWIVVGGICYSLGVIFYAQRRLKYGHAIWHLFVLAGTAVHYFAIVRYVVLE